MSRDSLAEVSHFRAKYAMHMQEKQLAIKKDLYTGSLSG